MKLDEQLSKHSKTIPQCSPHLQRPHHHTGFSAVCLKVHLSSVITNARLV